MNIPDISDHATLLEEKYNELILNQHVNRHREQPEYNAKGEKVCLDCDEVIPHKRAAIEYVVRCIDCQQELER